MFIFKKQKNHVLRALTGSQSNAEFVTGFFGNVFAWKGGLILGFLGSWLVH